MSKPPLPEGYEPHELPADYTGPLWIESQMQAYGQACREAALEEAAICAWSHYMDTCKANNIAPASSDRWLASGKIRSFKS